MGDTPNAVIGDVPSAEIIFQNAKSFMLKQSSASGRNLYDHLCQVLMKILDERPTDVVDIFEDISKTVKKEKFISSFDTVQEEAQVSPEVALATTQKTLFEATDEEGAEAADDEVQIPLPNLMELAHYFEDAGVGLSREETFKVFLACKNLVDSHPLQTVRFWGKVLGTEKNYIVAEAEYREGEEEEEEEAGEEAEKDEEDKEDIGDEEGEEDAPPKSEWKAPPTVPKEEKGTGTNKKVYFVCNEPGDLWVKLPSATPQQIQIARQIKKYFTGKLDAPVTSFPPFPGNEINYLRVQVARISAGTQISPLGFYQFDEDEDAEEEGEARDNFVTNQDFEGLTTRELIDPSLGNWVHHVNHVLPQGRCTWFNPSQKSEEDFEDEDEDDDKEEPDEPEPEVGPPLLTPLSEDAEINGLAPWSVKMSSKRVSQYAVACVSSNLWPGAHAFGVEKKFENVYVGWGHKYSSENYSPPPTVAPMMEYASGPEISETDDPTVEQEAAFRAAQQEAMEADGDADEGDEEEEDD